MKIGIFSDLHLEFAPWEYDFKPGILYINAGDTHPSPAVRSYLEGKVKAAGSEYFEILGNHDHYGFEFPEKGNDLGFYPLSDNINMVGATLWTKLDPIGFEDYRNALVDARFIKGITHKKYDDAHEWAKEFIDDISTIQGSRLSVVVTHHSPSMKSCNPKYQNSGMNHFFHNELDNFVRKIGADVWIHGHTHDRSDYDLSGTRIICHPRGYPHESCHDGYEPVYIDLDL
jgi:Icc-related predicted phosphoesterase